MEYLVQYVLFFAKTLTVVLAILFVIANCISHAKKAKGGGAAIKVKNLNNTFDEYLTTLQYAIFDAKTLKQTIKDEKQARKAEKGAPPKSRLFVLNFKGDMRASAVASLREEVSALLQIATERDEVMMRIDSVGGAMHSYGLAASQLIRIRDRNIPLYVFVDKVAASGGYLLASPANRIYAAPFAIVGSIGVLMQLPNFNRLLKKHNVDFEQITAGQYKRTLSLFGENTSRDREKVREEIDEAHVLFKAFITRFRPLVDIDKVGTGEHWFGTQALELKLVDELMTSDEYLLNAYASKEIYEITYHSKTPLSQKLLKTVELSLQRLVESLVMDRAQPPNHGL